MTLRLLRYAPGPAMTRGSLVLVVNCGSSSVKAALIGDDGAHVLDFAVTGLGHAPRLRADGSERPVEAPDPASAVARVLDELEHRPELRQRLAASPIASRTAASASPSRCGSTPRSRPRSRR
jgi:hypothetical protein